MICTQVLLNIEGVKASQFGSNIDKKLHQDADQNFARSLIGLGTLFCEFWLESERPREQNALKNLWLCSIFAILAKLMRRDHTYIWSAFWSNWPSQFEPQNPSKNPPKRLPNLIKKGIQNMMQVGLDLAALLGRFSLDLGPKIGGRWHPY